MDKRRLVTEIVEKLSSELRSLSGDGRGTESADESPAWFEGADRLAAELKQNISHYQAIDLRGFGADDPIAVSALVELADSARRRSLYFIGPKGGGLEVGCDGREILVITPQSPLGSRLLGHRRGDCIELALGGARQELTISSVA